MSGGMVSFRRINHRIRSHLRITLLTTRAVECITDSSKGTTNAKVARTMDVRDGKVRNVFKTTDEVSIVRGVPDPVDPCLVAPSHQWTRKVTSQAVRVETGVRTRSHIKCKLGVSERTIWNTTSSGSFWDAEGVGPISVGAIASETGDRVEHVPFVHIKTRGIIILPIPIRLGTIIVAELDKILFISSDEVSVPQNEMALNPSERC